MHQVDKRFHLLVPSKIRYIARKYGLPEYISNQVYQDLIAEDVDNDTKLILAQAMKYSMKQEHIKFDIEKLFEILGKNQDISIKSEIVWTLGYQMKGSFSRNSNKPIDENLVNQINSVIEKIENQISAEAMSFLNDQIRSQYFVNDRNYRSTTQRKIRKPMHPLKAAVTKNQQTEKMKYKNSESEELTNTLNSVNFFKNLKRKVAVNVNTEMLPIIPDKSGSDTSILRTTHQEVEYLYNRAKSGQTIKKQDKDIYLPSKFIGIEKKWFLNPVMRRMEGLIIDRMIADIFLEISKKQILPDNTIDLLMQCIDDLDGLEKKLIGGSIGKGEIVIMFITCAKISDFIFSFLLNNKIPINTNREEIIEAIHKELKKIRYTAITAIYNCATRNKTILTNQRLEKIQKHIKDDDDDFKKCIIEILGTLASSKNVDHKEIFNECLKQLEQGHIYDSSIKYMYEQSKDVIRCQELFNERSITIICNLFEQITLDEKTKMDVCMIINNYLEHSSNEGLNETQFEIYANLIDNPLSGKDLKLEALRSIVLTVEKKKKLPKRMIEKLVKNINKDDDIFDNFVILVLGIVSELQPIPTVDNLAIKLLVDWVVVRDGVDITFEKSSSYNKDCQWISSMVAQMFVIALQNNIRISDKSIEYLVKALNSNDKQTCISSAKSLYLASDTHEIEDVIINELKEYTDNKIYDVSVFSTAAYARGLARLASANKPIMRSNISFLPTIYVFENLQLGQEDFTDEVNKNILSVLFNEAANKKFEDNVFQIFNHILLFKNHYEREIIDVLRKYSANKYFIPEDTIFALENIVNIPEFSNQVLQVFENIIYNKQIVSEKILHIIADNLYLSNNNKVRDNSFHLLNMVNNNQDISDEIFDILEIERASLIIASFSPYSNDAISYLCEKTKEGQKLTLNCFRALNIVTAYKLKLNEEILRILLNSSSNGQIIPSNLINRLVRRFNPKIVQKYLLEIFENLVKNNQNIPTRLSSKLERALDNATLSDKVLFIFVLQGQTGKKLSEKVIRKILNKFLTLENSLTMQQYLPIICSVIENHDYFEYNTKNIFQRILYWLFGTRIIRHVQTALLHALKADNQEVVRKSIRACKPLLSLHKINLDKKIIEVLLSLTTNTICDESMHQDINMLLNISKLDKSQKCAYELANLKFDSNNELLDKLIAFGKPKLLEKNFDQINCIIDKCSELNLKALEILLKCSNKENIPDKLLDSISVLLASTSSKDIKSMCCQLIVEIAKTERKLTNEIISLIFDQDENDVQLEILELISKNQTYSEELEHKIILFSKINPTISIDAVTLGKFLNNIHLEYERNQKLSSLSIQKLLSLKISETEIQNNLEQELINIYALILIQNPDYSSNKAIVASLEKAILSKMITKNILEAFKEVIKRTNCETNNYSRIFDVFIDILGRNDKYIKFHFDILVCLVLACETTKISQLEPLETNLDNDNEIIRCWSFRGLRAAYEKGSISLAFKDWCDDIICKLRKNTNIKVQFDLNLLEVIVALKYIDFKKIRGKPYDQWNRELLIFDLLERFQISEVERFQFYQTWLDIEEWEGFQKGQCDLLLKLLHRYLVNTRPSFNQCYDAIKILNRIDFESSYKILSNSKNPCLDLNKKYLTEIIYQRLSNKKDISPKYVDGLASRMISKLGIDVSQALLYTIQSIDSLKEFEDILNFAEKNNIELSDIYVKNISISILKRSLEIKFLGNQIKEADRLKLAVYLDNLLDRNWTFEQLNKMFSVFKASKSPDKVRYFVHVLEILSHYKILPKHESQVLIALEKSAEYWLREINIIAMETNFSEKGQLKSAGELIKELLNSNSHNQNLTNLTEATLRNRIEKIKSSKLTSLVFSNSEENESKQHNSYSLIPIVQWTQEQIRLWANLVKDDPNIFANTEDFIIESLAVIKQANFLDTEFHLTDAQILSCLMALNAASEQGRLLQVGTGEGKSTIISVLAVVHALEGKNVDIITSSPVLAERDSKEKEKFYRMFDLQCSDNNDRAVYLLGPKSCYKKQIVYGEAAQFQFDTLRTEYAQLNTLADRTCDVAIVDEVDSMLIDDSSKIARLATTMSGMDQLQIIYHLLWNQLVSFQEKIVEFNNKLYLFYGNIGFEEEKVTLEYANEQGTIMLISDLKNYLASTLDISHIGQLIPENEEFDVFIKKNLENYIRKFIEKNIKIPNSFADFVQTQIPIWINNAIIAFNYQENIHYIVHDGVIKPVDYYSTGIVQSFSNWSDGLHQFLQIKHSLKMTSETFTTNFLSNRGYFTKYGSNLFGLTGTLGSQKAKQVLVDVYKVDLVIIPNLRQKQYLSLPDIVVINEVDWLNEIYQSGVNESIKGRGVLVICETIEQSKIIAEKFQKDYLSSRIKQYTMNNMNQEKNVEIVNSEEIIIATNLAGRGTDIKTDEIEKYGGLHVIITFMPSNKRVEEQAFGRTARQGKRGTGQRILNAVNLTHYEDFDIQKITQLRDKIEANMLSDFEKSELKLISLKDELFVKFCTLLKEIRIKIRKKTDPISKLKNLAKSVFVNVGPSVFESNVLLSIEEQWAMFLRNIDHEKSNIDTEKFHEDYENFRHKIIKDYENFLHQITKDYEKDCVIKNPYYHIVIANDLVINDSSLNSKYDTAMKHFDQAIDLDPNHCAAAFVGRGWLLLKGKERFFLSNEQDLDYKDAAVRAFQRALQILSEEMALLTSMQTLLQHRSLNINNPLSKQLIQKTNILGSYCNSLDNVVNVIKRSQRLIEIAEINNYSNTTENVDNNGVLKETIFFNEIEKGNGKWCNIRLISQDQVKHHATAIEECKEIVVFQEKGEEFTIVYKQKEEKALTNWTVDDPELSYHLASLTYDGTILDRNNYTKLYTRIYARIKLKKGYVRGDFLAPLQTLSDNREYEVTFNHLTIREDCGTIDQAIETINMSITNVNEGVFHSVLQSTANFFKKKGVLSSSYQHISISLSRINAETLEGLIKPDIEIKEATKEVALAHLKDKSSFFHRHLLTEMLSLDSYDVNLEIILENNTKETESRLTDSTRCDPQVGHGPLLENTIVVNGLKVRNAIEKIEEIEEKPEDNVHFNLTFISANEISKVIKNEVLRHSNLTVEFIDLNGQKVLEKLATIVSQNIILDLSDQKEQLLKAINSVAIDYIELYSLRKEETISEIVNKTVAEGRIKQMTADTMTIKLSNMNSEAVKKIIDICQNGNFNIHFVNINLESLLKGLNDELVNVHFNSLGKETAKILIKEIRKCNLDFNLRFKNLKNDQAQRLIEAAPIDQENIEINKVKTLSELFMNEIRPDLELSEFFARGIEYLLEISEKQFVPWFSIAAVVALAAVQMAVGGVLIATGFGATVGMGLITEGAADLFTAYRAYSTRQFNWSDYGKQKAVSLIISAATMGFSAIKDAGKGVQTLVTGAKQEVLEQAGTRLITDGKAAGKVLAQTGKNLKSLAVKQIGVTVGENTLREGLTRVADLSSHFVLERLKPQISDSIQNKVNGKFCKSNLMKIVRKMYAMDLMNKQQQQLKGKINKIVVEIINPEHNFWRKQWDSIGGPLCSGILSSVDRIRGPASLGIRILGTLNGMHQITFIIQKVHDQLLKKLSEIDRETLSIDQILYRHCSVSKECIPDIVNLFEMQGILVLNDHLENQNFLTKLIQTDFNEYNMYKDNIVNFLKLLHTNMLEVEFNDFSEIMKLVSDTITDQVLRITQSQLISPWSSYGMGELTKAISERAQHHFIVDEKQNSDSQNREKQQNEGNKDDKILKIEESGSKYNTISKQIRCNARDYTIAYSQCEIIHYSEQKENIHHGRIDEKTKEYTEGIRKDKPANLSDMIGLAAQYGLDIKLVDDPDYQPTDEDTKKGTNIVVYRKGEVDSEGKNSIGHFQLKLGNGTIIDIPTDKNNCGYGIIQKLLSDRGVNTSIDDLRNNRAQMIEDNPRQFSKVWQAQQWIEVRYPQEARSFLIEGGARKAKRTFEQIMNDGLEELAGRYGSLDNLLRGRQGILELNHIPPKASYRGTPYECITENDMPVMVMNFEDHRKATSTGRSDIATGYHADIQQYLREGNMYAALKLELNDMLNINSQRRYYEGNVRQFIDYVASTPVRNAPLNAEGRTTLITQTQAYQLKEDLFGQRDFS